MERIARFFQIRNINGSLAGILISVLVLLGVAINFSKFYNLGQVSGDYSFLLIHTGLSALLTFPILSASIWVLATQSGREYLVRVSTEPRTRGLFWYLKATVACSVLGNITFFSLWLICIILIGREVVEFPFSSTGQGLLIACMVIWAPVVWRRLT